MRKLLLLGLLTLSGVLAACGGDPDAELARLNHGGELRLATDVEALVEPLSAFADTRFVPPNEFVEVVAEDDIGAVSYTLVPKDWLETRFEIPYTSRMCQLILCDDEGNPVPDPLGSDFIVGVDFTAVYATPALLTRSAEFGYDARDLEGMDARTLARIVAETGLGVAGVSDYGVSDHRVSDYLPGSPAERFCQARPQPRICQYIAGEYGLELVELDVSELNEH